MAKVLLTDDALEDLRGLGGSARKLVIKALGKLRDSPELRGAPLGSRRTGNLTGFRKVVVGDRQYRIVYRVEDDGTICVVWVMRSKPSGGASDRLISPAGGRRRRPCRAPRAGSGPPAHRRLVGIPHGRERVSVVLPPMSRGQAEAWSGLLDLSDLRGGPQVLAPARLLHKDPEACEGVQGRESSVLGAIDSPYPAESACSARLVTCVRALRARRWSRARRSASAGTRPGAPCSRPAGRQWAGAQSCTALTTVTEVVSHSRPASLRPPGRPAASPISHRALFIRRTITQSRTRSRSRPATSATRSRRRRSAPRRFPVATASSHRFHSSGATSKAGSPDSGLGSITNHGSRSAASTFE